MVGDVDHGEQDAEVVSALQVADARVDVLGMEAMVLEAVIVRLCFTVRPKSALTSGTERT